MKKEYTEERMAQSSDSKSSRSATRLGAGAAVTRMACRRGEMMPAYMLEKVHGHCMNEPVNIGVTLT